MIPEPALKLRSMSSKFLQKKLGYVVHIPAAILQQIRVLGLRFHPKEFGGIFLGQRSDDGKEINITEMVLPTKFVSKSTVFTRHPDNLNQRIAQVYKETNGQVNYVGEWHTHPNGNSQFSGKDLKTMQEISKSSEVKTSTPLLLIAGVTKRTYSPTIYILQGNTLHKFANSNSTN